MSQFDLEELIRDLLRRVLLLETTQPMGYSSVSEGRSRFIGNESVLVQGSGKVEGWWIVTGTQRVTGRLEGSGTLDWTGPWFLRGLGEITGDVDITGALDVLNRLTLGPSGYIEAGTVRIDRAGTYGGRIASTGAILALSAGGSVIIDGATLVAGEASLGATTCMSLDTIGAKNFKMQHPLKPDVWLRHGSTESPVSGVEYWGEETLPESGELTVQLPDYFEALTKADGRAVLVTARGFVADWGDIEDGTFTVTGTPGGRFSWLVKAERFGGDFPLEEHVYGPKRA